MLLCRRGPADGLLCDHIEEGDAAQFEMRWTAAEALRLGGAVTQLGEQLANAVIFRDSQLRITETELRDAPVLRLLPALLRLVYLWMSDIDTHTYLFGEHIFGDPIALLC
jgi:hypothetical protein